VAQSTTFRKAADRWRSTGISTSNLQLLRSSKYFTLAHFTSVTFANPLTLPLKAYWEDSHCYRSSTAFWLEGTHTKQPPLNKHRLIRRPHANDDHEVDSSKQTPQPVLPAIHPTNTVTMAQTETSINIPQLLAVALVGFFAIRWYLNKPPPSSPGSSSSTGSSTSRANRGVDLAQIAQVSAMFPQLDRRSIAWDLHRNGGNVAGTSERILTGRGLDNPPPSFQPVLPEPAVQVPTTGSGARSGAGGQPDLITRYGLQGRIGDKGKEAVPSEEQKRSAWTSDKAARAEGLKRRREEMVLEARRKMLERDGRA
jgi:coupling of ubiquitin conjugation to ER degradation protein 1